MQSNNYSFKNNFGSFTSIKVVVPVKQDNQFYVFITVRKATEKGILMQNKEVTYSSDRYQAFIEDLQYRCLS